MILCLGVVGDCAEATGDLFITFVIYALNIWGLCLGTWICARTPGICAEIFEVRAKILGVCEEDT